MKPCCPASLAAKHIIEKKGWYCEGHKKCEKCRLKSSTNKNKLLFCDICDVAWHLGCLPQQYDKIPEGVWACPDCLKRNPNVLKEQQRLNKLRKRVQDAEDGEESPSSKRRKVAHRKIDTVKRTKAELEQETKPFFDLYYANKDGPRTLLLADLSRTLSSLDSECLTYIKTTIGGDTYADIGRASETAFLPEDRGFSKSSPRSTTTRTNVNKTMQLGMKTCELSYHECLLPCKNTSSSKSAM
ncbi:hypothetical protein BDZ89DRAFT_659850 [Hymenopellis radicata]|nr:hypothetical protein BDZ89DRAFT_659850 [Hymenopellis radicata]